MQDATRTSLKALEVSRSASAGAVARTCMVGAMAAALAVCAPAAGAVATQPAGETVARLYAAAVVTDDTVRLADVAELDGEAARLAGSWVVAIAPQVGGTRVVELDDVQRALANKDANLSQWVFRGSSRCTVSRPKSCISPASRPAAVEAGSMEKLAGGGSGHIDAYSLEAALRGHLGRKLAEMNGVPVIKFSPVVSKVLALTRPQYEFRITDRSTQPLGMVSLEVAIGEQGKPVQTLTMLVHVSVRKPVVVAARAINRSQRIEASDLTMAERLFDRIEDVGLSDPAPLMGQQAKRPVNRGEQLSTKDVEPVPLVQRNDLVTVWVRRGGVSVKGAAKAIGTASYGQPVTLKNDASNQTFTAIVTGPRTAEVSGDGLMVSEQTVKEQSR